jgi:hypothetical protein
MLRIRWLLAMAADIAYRPPAHQPSFSSKIIPLSTGRHAPSANRLSTEPPRVGRRLIGLSHAARAACFVDNRARAVAPSASPQACYCPNYEPALTQRFDMAYSSPVPTQEFVS